MRATADSTTRVSARLGRRSLLLGSAVVLTTGLASSQTLTDLHLRRINGHVRFYSEIWDETRATTSTNVEQQEFLRREEVGLRFRGDYYHPKLLEYDLSLTLGLEQRDIDSSGTPIGRSVNSGNREWDLRARLFKDLSYSADLYSFRNETQTRQSFFPTTEAIVNETGVNVNAKNWWIPSQLHAHHHGYSGQGLDTFGQSLNNVSLRGTRADSKSQTNYMIEFNDIVNTGAARTSLNDLSFSASTSHAFGSAARNRWSASARYRDQGGDFASENRGATARVSKALTSNLIGETSLDYTLSEAGQGTFTETYTGSGGLTHQLFSSLSSTGTLRTSKTRLGGGNIDVTGLLGQLTYRKETPIGRLGIRYYLDQYRQDQQDLQGLSTVLDESHVASFSVPIFLTNLAVEPGSILVTDDTNTIVYTAGSDYIVSQIGSRTRIEIPVGSLISPGDTILVDYSFAPSPALEFESKTQSIGFSLRMFDRADLNISHTSASQDLLSGVSTGTLEDSNRTFASLHIFPFGTNLGVEYEDYQASFAPFQRTSFLGSYRRTTAAGATWRVSANTFRTRFEDQPESESGTSASFSIFQNRGRNTSWNLQSEWHRVRFRTDRGTGYLIEAKYTRRFRALDLSLNVRYTDENFAVASDQQVTAVFISISRTF